MPEALRQPRGSSENQPTGHSAICKRNHRHGHYFGRASRNIPGIMIGLTAITNELDFPDRSEIMPFSLFANSGISCSCHRPTALNGRNL